MIKDAANIEFKITPKLNALLKEHGISQRKLAQLAGVPQPSINRFDGNTERFQIAHLLRIAYVLGVSIEDLFIIEAVEKPQQTE